MAEMNRTIQELLADYAGALRDGNIGAFLKSLTRVEGREMVSSGEFWEAAEAVQILNGVAFSEKAVTPNVSLFMSRIDAAIASRMKKARAPFNISGGSKSKRVTETEETEKRV